VLNNDYNRNGLKNAANIESVICLSVLIAKGNLKYDATIDDMRYYCKISYGNDCNYCEHSKICLACIINE
jgi:hypothetical protein